MTITSLFKMQKSLLFLGETFSPVRGVRGLRASATSAVLAWHTPTRAHLYESYSLV